MPLLDIIGVTAPTADPVTFDENEVKDLALHVRQCGRRYRALDAKLNIAIRLILVLCGLYAINNLSEIRHLFGLS